MHNLLIKILTRSGLAMAALRVLTKNRRFVLNFHGVSSRRYADIKNDLQPHHSKDEFRQTLLWISQHFNFLSVQDLLETSKPGVLLTFDDGHASNLINVLPVLEEFDVQGLFFVSTQHVLNPRDWLGFTRKDAIRGWGAEDSVPDGVFARDCYDGLSEHELIRLSQSRLAVIGAHTVNHPPLPDCTPDEISYQLSESRAYLQKVTGKAVDYFAYPFGKYNLTAANIAHECGFKAAFAVDPIHAGMPLYEIPRVGIYDSVPEYLAMKLSGLHRRAIHGKII